MILRYLWAATAAVALAAGAYGYVQHRMALSLRLELAATTGELASCGARLDNILEDLRSDGQVDDLSDDDLRSVPSRWLRPDGASAD